MKQGLHFDHDAIAYITGVGPHQEGRIVLTDEQVAAIRMIVREEIERHEDETAKLIDESHKAGFDPFNGI